MPEEIVTAAFIIGIVALFVLDRDRETATAKALWVPIAWLLINGSRPVSSWLATLGAESTLPPAGVGEQYLDGSPIDRYVFTGLLCVGVVIVGSRKQAGRLLLRNGPILLFFLYCGLSVLWSDYSLIALKRWFKGIGDLVMVMIVLTDPKPEVAIRRLLAWTGFLLVPLSVLFVKYYPDLGRVYNKWTWAPMYTGVTTGKNHLGMICLIFGIASVWRMVSERRKRRDPRRVGRLVAHGTVLVMVLWLFTKANSVTSLSCFVIGSGLVAVTAYSARRRRPTLVHVLVGATVGASIFALFLDPGGDLLTNLGRDRTLTGRTAIWQLVVGLAGNPLVGTGYESFWLGDRLRKVWDVFDGIQQAHNGYLEVFLNLGWIGVVLLALLLVTGYRNAMNVVRQDAEAGSWRIAYFAAAVSYNLTEAGCRMMFPIWCLLLLSTVALPKMRVRQRVTQPAVDGYSGRLSNPVALNKC